MAKKIISILTVLLIISFVVLVVINYFEEKQVLIQVAVSDAIKDGPDFHYAENDDEVFLLKDMGINKNLTTVDGKKIVLLTRMEIANRVKTDGNFVYITIDRIFIFFSKASVSLSCDATQTELLFGGGIKINYEKVNGKWIGEIVYSVIS